jgi:hypothetical protein
MLQIIEDYLKRLRALVPARTMAVYTAMIGLYPMVSTKATELPEWIPFVVIALCLAFQVLLGIFSDKKKWYVILLSAIAFCLYGITQPYIGILGIFEVEAAVQLVFSLIIIVYVAVVPMIVTEFNR